MRERYFIIKSLFLRLLENLLQNVYPLSANSMSHTRIITFYLDMIQKWMGVFFWQRQIALKKVIYAGGTIAVLFTVFLTCGLHSFLLIGITHRDKYNVAKLNLEKKCLDTDELGMEKEKGEIDLVI